MSDTKFKVGDRVALHSYQIAFGKYDKNVFYGKVVSIPEIKDHVIVLWDPDFDNHPQLIKVSTLHFEDEIKKKNSELEKEFISLQEQVAKKINKIALELKDVRKLTNKYSVKELYNSEEFIDALEFAGWNMSSHKC